MKKSIPQYLPPYTIRWKDEPPFPVTWEEMMGWFIVPKLGETLTWGMYDLPSRKLDVAYDMAVTGKAKVHGIEGVSFTARVIQPYDPLKADDIMNKPVEDSGAVQEEWTFIAQLAQGHTRFLSAERNEDGCRTLNTFLDEEFMNNWGFGENNCGNDIHCIPRGIIHRTGSVITSDREKVIDVAGRCEVVLDGKPHDCICVMDLSQYNEDCISEQYLGRDGRTVLWRRFNRDDWAIDRYGKPWSVLLPDNEQLTVNGQTYVHWYDCLCIR